jgi:hypothetical protein
MEEKRNTYTVILGKPEGKRPLGRPTSRWVANIKVAVYWIVLAKDRDRWKTLYNPWNLSSE